MSDDPHDSLNRLVEKAELDLSMAQQTLESVVESAARLVAKASALVAMLDDSEVNHGGLWSGKTMRARDDLRLELSRWRKE